MGMKSLQAHLLLAAPQLPDPNFNRSVVFLISHDEEGAFGVILNRPTPVKLAEIWNEVAGAPCENRSNVYLGGPVQGPLIALHQIIECAESEVMPGVYVATQKESLNTIVQHEGSQFRLFSGYSGWGEGQLEAEMEVGGWLTMPAEIDHVFGDDEALWQEVADKIGKEILFPDHSLPNGPSDPSLN